jgi:hypothetical protein
MATFTYNACDGTSEDAAQALHRAGEKVGRGLIDHLLDLSETSRGSYAGPVGWRPNSGISSGMRWMISGMESWEYCA